MRLAGLALALVLVPLASAAMAPEAREEVRVIVGSAPLDAALSCLPASAGAACYPLDGDERTVEFLIANPLGLPTRAGLTIFVGGEVAEVWAFCTSVALALPPGADRLFLLLAPPLHDPGCPSVPLVSLVTARFA